jgi:hypothetical protein
VVAIDHSVRPGVLATLRDVLGQPSRREDGATTWRLHAPRREPGSEPAPS